MHFNEARNDFIEEKKYQGVSPATIRYCERRIDAFEAYADVHELTDSTSRAVRKWLMSKDGVSRNTIANYDRALRVFSNWLEKRGYLDASPMASVPKPRHAPTKITTFSADEIAKIMGVAEESQNPLRDKALITMLLDTGVRIGEAMSLELHDVDWKRGMLEIRGKTGERSTPSAV